VEAAALTLNGMLEASGIDLREVVVMRHRPWEQQLNKALDGIVAKRRELFERYQSTHAPRVESAMSRAEFKMADACRRAAIAQWRRGNKLLQGRVPANFAFSILQLVSPAVPREDVCEIEGTRTKRLLSAAPNGLNEN